MAITLAQSAVAARATSGTVTATLGTAPTAGNLLVAVFGNNGGSASYTPPAGWTDVIHRQSGSAAYAAVWMRVASASEPAAVVYTPASGSDFNLHLMEFSGLAVPTIDKVAGADSGASTVTTFTTTATGALGGAGDLMIVGTFHSAAFGTETAAGFTQAALTVRSSSYWAIAPDQTTKTATASWVTATKVCAVLATISPAAIAAAGFTGWGIPM